MSLRFLVCEPEGHTPASPGVELSPAVQRDQALELSLQPRLRAGRKKALLPPPIPLLGLGTAASCPHQRFGPEWCITPHGSSSLSRCTGHDPHGVSSRMRLPATKQNNSRARQRNVRNGTTSEDIPRVSSPARLSTFDSRPCRRSDVGFRARDALPLSSASPPAPEGWCIDLTRFHPRGN